MKTGTLLLGLLLFGLILSPGVMGQSTIAILTGQVVDKAGAPVPGVTVTAHSVKAAMRPAGTVTDSQGRFRLKALPPSDDYVLHVELPGYAVVEVRPIELAPGKTTNQNITLAPASEATEKVTIIARGDIVDLASTKTSTIFNSEFIEGLPIIGRAYQDVLTLAPGVTDSDGDGNPNVNGARDTDFQTRVDGVNTTDPVSGTFGQNLNLESIAEIEVITTGASAEFSQAQGGFANIITKSGGNDFEGSFKMFLRSDLLDNDGANNSDQFPDNTFDDLDGFTDFRPFLTVGGPFVKDRFWYFASLQFIDQELPVNTLTAVVKRTQKGWNNFGKVTYQPATSHRLSLSVNFDPREFSGLGLRAGVEPESDFFWEQGGTNTTLGWTYNISPALLLEVKIARLDTGIAVTPVSTADPNPDCRNAGLVNGLESMQCNPFSADVYTLSNTTTRVFGPYFFRQDDERTRNTLRADLSIFAEGFGGTHNLKTGFEFAHEALENTLRQDPIRFNNVQRGGPGDPPSGSISFLRAFPSAYGGLGCFPVGVGTQEACENLGPLEGDKDNFGFYIQDSFKPRPNLSINVGLRFDREEATTDGFTLFDPKEEAGQFLDLLVVASGLSLEEFVDQYGGSLDNFLATTYPAAMAQPLVQFDVNGDAKDFGYCGTDFPNINRYDNDLVAGFLVAANGTYTLVGDDNRDDNGNGIADWEDDLNGNGIIDLLDPDGRDEDFFQFVDTGGPTICQGGLNFKGPCAMVGGSSPDCPNGDGTFNNCLAAADGKASFDPALIGVPVYVAGQFDHPDYDVIQFDPNGGLGDNNGNDANNTNPNCDLINEDTAALFSVFSRHQLDLTEGPIDLNRIPGLDNNCREDFAADDSTLPGTCRSHERFKIANNNLAPRLSASWDPWANNKTKIFVTWSRFYDRLFLATLIPELGPDTRSTVYDASSLLDGINAQPISTGRFSTTQVDRNMATPYSDEFTFGFERELAPEWALGLTYVKREGHDQLQDTDFNHFVLDANGDGVLDDHFGLIGTLFTGDPDGQGQPLPPTVTRAPDGQPDLFGYNPLFNQVLRVGNFNFSEYESLQLVLTRRLSRQWQMQASYVWSEALGNAEGFQQALGNDPGTSDDEFGFLSFDQTHVVKFNAVTFLPGDQSLGTTIQWASGLPYSLIITQLSGDNFDSLFFRTTFPTSQRNDQRNEGRWNININYKKNFVFGKYHASVGVEVADLLNSDDLQINDFDLVRFGINANRDFGRFWQLSGEFHF